MSSAEAPSAMMPARTKAALKPKRSPATPPNTGPMLMPITRPVCAQLKLRPRRSRGTSTLIRPIVGALTPVAIPDSVRMSRNCQGS